MGIFFSVNNLMLFWLTCSSIPFGKQFCPDKNEKMFLPCATLDALWYLTYLYRVGGHHTEPMGDPTTLGQWLNPMWDT